MKGRGTCFLSFVLQEIGATTLLAKAQDPQIAQGPGKAMALLSLDGESNLELCGGRFPANNEQMPQ